MYQKSTRTKKYPTQSYTRKDRIRNEHDHRNEVWYNGIRVNALPYCHRKQIAKQTGICPVVNFVDTRRFVRIVFFLG